MSLSSLISLLSGLIMPSTDMGTSESNNTEVCDTTPTTADPVHDPMSTEELVRNLLERLGAGDKLDPSTATSLTAAIASAISYRLGSNTTAAHDVLHTTELLEAILLDNDLTTITSAQRVSQQFQATVQGSSRLQSKLWTQLKPEPSTRCQIPKCKCRGKGKNKNFKPEINPLLSDHDFCKRFAIRSFNYELREDEEHRLIIDVTFGTIAELRALKPGGWQKMLVMQPVSRAKDWWNLSFTYEDGKFTRSMGRGTWYDALTLGELVEVLLERWEELEVNPWKSVSELEPDWKGKAKGHEPSVNI